MADIFSNPALTDCINSIQQGIKSNRFNSEAKVETGIVLRLLQVLGWDTYNTDQVVPKDSMKTHQSTVQPDFLLCDDRNTMNKKIKIVIEAKAVGKINDAVDQLFGYLLHSGAGFGIATDGREWYFYLAQADRAKVKEKFIQEVNIVNDSPSYTASVLHRYLEYRRVVNGEALGEIMKVFNHRRVETQIRETWDRLIKGIKRDHEESKKLINPLVNQVRSDMPQAPARKEVQKAVAVFLESLALHTAEKHTHTQPQASASGQDDSWAADMFDDPTPDSEPASPPAGPRHASSPSKTKKKSPKILKIWYNGQEVEGGEEGKKGDQEKKIVNLMLKLPENVLYAIAEKEKEKEKRPFLIKSIDTPKQPNDSANRYSEVMRGYWVLTSLDIQTKKKTLERIAKEYNLDIVVTIPDA